jgi:amidase
MFKQPMLALLTTLAASSASAADQETWLITTDLWGNPLYQTLELVRDAGRISGTLDGDAVQGEIVDDRIRFTATDSRQRIYLYDGKIDSVSIIGTSEQPDTNHADRRVNHPFVARPIPSRPAGAPRHYNFKPTDYANEFTAHRNPVLTLWPGDSVRTTTIDSGGVDENGQTRALFGNPQTGPFFVGTAEPGDTLVVHIKRLRLSRDYADSLDSIVAPALATSLAARATELGKPIRWSLDRARGVATPENASVRLRDFEVPLRPMLGGLAVAPGFGSAPISTGDTGRFGGNMDFNEVIEGNTVYLPVMQPGALLYLGDAHALQGDGETSQYGLETSMDVEFSVDVIHGESIAMPRVESPTHIMVLGQAGSLDNALRLATAGLTQWLELDYALDLSESAQVLGSSVQYSVVNLAGRSVGVAAKLEKARLSGLKRVD